MNSDKDYYATLGVLASAEGVVIRAAYKALAQHYHPDRNASDRSSQARMVEINEAYAVLSDPALRAKYDALRGQKSANHSTSPPHSSAPPPERKPSSSTNKASIWKRFAARFIDTSWEALLIGVGIGFLAPYDAELNEFIQQANPLLLSMIVLPLALVLDGIILDVCKNTPGKALFGVQVRHKTGKPLSTADHLSRNSRLWLQGFALGVPLLSMISLIVQAHRVRNSGYTTYDYPQKIEVLSKPIGVPRAAVGYTLALLFLLANSIFFNISADTQRLARSNNYFDKYDTPQDPSWEGGTIRQPVQKRFDPSTARPERPSGPDLFDDLVLIQPGQSNSSEIEQFLDPATPSSSDALIDQAASDAAAQYPYLNDAAGENDYLYAVVAWRDHFIGLGNPMHIAIQSAAQQVDRYKRAGYGACFPDPSKMDGVSCTVPEDPSQRKPYDGPWNKFR